MLVRLTKAMIPVHVRVKRGVGGGEEGCVCVCRNEGVVEFHLGSEAGKVSLLHSLFFFVSVYLFGNAVSSYLEASVSIMVGPLPSGITWLIFNSSQESPI